jgi:hypothetical protein
MSAMTRRQAALDVGGFREEIRIAPDFEFWVRMAVRFPFVWTQQATSNYRWHDRQISRDRLAQMQSIYHSRALIAQQTEASGSSELASALRDRLRALIDKDLDLAWWRTDMPRVEALLKIAEVHGFDTPVSRKVRRLAKLPARWVRGWRAVQALVESGKRQTRTA